MDANQFIVGKWYRDVAGRYGKFSKISGVKGEPNRYFHFSELLDKNLNHTYTNGTWYRTNIEKEADMSIIACQLPYPVETELNYQIF